jgi:phosphoribosylglycinamide formyltransferase-1
MTRALSKLGILISGRGSNMVALVEATRDGTIPAEVVLVVSNRAGAEGLAKAEALGLPTRTQVSKGRRREEHDESVAELMEGAGVDLICLAGYMRLLSPAFVERFRGRLLNIHPSLLPAFPGLDAAGQALEHGVKQSGCTVHFIDEELDHGPIIAQAVVDVLDDDDEPSLSARILEQEHRLYAKAVARVLAGDWRLDGRRFCRR